MATQFVMQSAACAHFNAWECAQILVQDASMSAAATGAADTTGARDDASVEGWAADRFFSQPTARALARTTAVTPNQMGELLGSHM
jgi:hypothetical protein